MRAAATLAWPGSVLTGLLLFRKQIGGLIDRIERAKLWNLEVVAREAAAQAVVTTLELAESEDPKDQEQLSDLRAAAGRRLNAVQTAERAAYNSALVRLVLDDLLPITCDRCGAEAPKGLIYHDCPQRPRFPTLSEEIEQRRRDEGRPPA